MEYFKYLHGLSDKSIRELTAARLIGKERRNMEENNSLAKVIAVYGSVIDAVFCRSRAAVIGTMPNVCTSTNEKYWFCRWLSTRVISAAAVALGFTYRVGRNMPVAVREGYSCTAGFKINYMGRVLNIGQPD